MSIRNFKLTIGLFGLMLILLSCSKSDDDKPCGSASILIGENEICLIFEHQGLTNDLRSIIETEVSTGISLINNLMEIDDIQIRIVDNSNIIPVGFGIGGYNPNEQEVIIAVNTNFNNLDSCLEQSFIPLLAHEIHHAKRRRSVGYGNTLLQAVVSEGLADHFSIEVTGVAPPPWSVALSGSDLQEWLDTASSTWDDSPYNHEAWFLGTDPNIPRWAGYSIGFEIVKNYLIENPDRLPSTLHNEPAESFRP